MELPWGDSAEEEVSIAVTAFLFILLGLAAGELFNEENWPELGC